MLHIKIITCDEAANDVLYLVEGNCGRHFSVHSYLKENNSFWRRKMKSPFYSLCEDDAHSTDYSDDDITLLDNDSLVECTTCMCRISQGLRAHQFTTKLFRRTR